MLQNREQSGRRGPWQRSPQITESEHSRVPNSFSQVKMDKRMPHSLGWREMSAIQGARHLSAERSRQLSRPETCLAHCLCRLAGTPAAAEGFPQARRSRRRHNRTLHRGLPGHTAQPPPPISTYLFASNHRSGRAGVGGKRSRCFLAAISLEAARFDPCYSFFRREGRTTAGSAASIL